MTSRFDSLRALTAGADVHIAVAFRSVRDLFLPRVCGICRESVSAGVAGRLCTGCIFQLEDLATAPSDACPRCALVNIFPRYLAGKVKREKQFRRTSIKIRG